MIHGKTKGIHFLCPIVSCLDQCWVVIRKSGENCFNFHFKSCCLLFFSTHGLKIEFLGSR